VKYSINGFSQEAAVTFRKTISDKKGKTKEIKLDCTDLQILRWIVDFYPNMRKTEINGLLYVWVSYKNMIEDLPLLDIKKQALADRLQKMCEFEILERTIVREGGTYSYYRFGKMYGKLIDTKYKNKDKEQEAEYSTTRECGSQLQEGEYSTTEQINPSTKYSSTKNNTKERKKESPAADTYDSIINNATEDEELRELYREYIKMRKLNKSPMTNRALKMLIGKVKELEPNSIDRQKQMLETAIMHNWKSVYPLKDQANGYAPPQGNQYGARREVINGKEYEVKNGKYYIPNGCNVAVDPFAEDDLAFLK
jgi:hypothetical protein